MESRKDLHSYNNAIYLNYKIDNYLNNFHSIINLLPVFLTLSLSDSLNIIMKIMSSNPIPMRIKFLSKLSIYFLITIIITPIKSKLFHLDSCIIVIIDYYTYPNIPNYLRLYYYTKKTLIKIHYLLKLNIPN